MVAPALATASILVVLAACTEDDPAVASGPTSVSAAISTVPPRVVAAPTDGALRVSLAAVDDGDVVDPTGPEGVLLFGDSVAVLIADELASELSGELHIDAVDCRRLDLGFEGPCGGVPPGTAVPAGLESLERTVADLADGGSLVDAAVVVLANNAALSADDLGAAMVTLDGVPRVWWVTTDVEGRGWRDPNNALLRDLAERDERAGVVDWFTASEQQDWRADHVHPDEEGQAALAQLVADHLRCDCVP